jgi:hypothetical protein
VYSTPLILLSGQQNGENRRLPETADFKPVLFLRRGAAPGPSPNPASDFPGHLFLLRPNGLALISPGRNNLRISKLRDTESTGKKKIESL